ncbi:MAG TPA: hypothetical protein DCY13_03445 [Verrucomicrobiales bacterium]|nr:hypothetical protein [Verrucomicrobiales bacterium]
MKPRVFLVLFVLLILSVISGWHRIRSARMQTENAVSRTAVSINRFGVVDLESLPEISKAAVDGARVQVINTNPFAFKISAMTPWPDLMIFEYDSRTPERGIYCYPF